MLASCLGLPNDNAQTFRRPTRRSLSADDLFFSGVHGAFSPGREHGDQEPRITAAAAPRGDDGEGEIIASPPFLRRIFRLQGRLGGARTT